MTLDGAFKNLAMAASMWKGNLEEHKVMQESLELVRRVLAEHCMKSPQNEAPPETPPDSTQSPPSE